MIRCDDIVAFVDIVQFLRPHSVSNSYKINVVWIYVL